MHKFAAKKWFKEENKIIQDNFWTRNGPYIVCEYVSLGSVEGSGCVDLSIGQQCKVTAGIAGGKQLIHYVSLKRK